MAMSLLRPPERDLKLSDQLGRVTTAFDRSDVEERLDHLNQALRRKLAGASSRPAPVTNGVRSLN